MINLVAGEATGIVVVRCFAQEVVGATHIDFAFGLHVEEREVECGAACVPRKVCDVAAME